MKITKRRLIQIIKEAVEGSDSSDYSAPGETALEITDIDVTEEQISDSWPKVSYNGQSVMDIMYNDRIMNSAEEALARYEGVEFEGQEGYLGYDRRDDVFVMGFDMWMADDYNDEGGEGNHNGAFVTITPDGSEIMVDAIYDGGGIYSNGYNKIKISRPEMIDLRLD
jgi:hypothetical protein